MNDLEHDAKICKITEQEVREYLHWKAVAKVATAKAKEIEIPMRIKFSHLELNATDVGPFKITLSTSGVDWDPDIIETIKNVEGVSDTDKAKLFHPPVRKSNGIHLNSIAKKYGGAVAERISNARQENRETFKIDANRVERHNVDQGAENFLGEKQKEENDNAKE